MPTIFLIQMLCSHLLKEERGENTRSLITLLYSYSLFPTVHFTMNYTSCYVSSPCPILEQSKLTPPESWLVQWSKRHESSLCSTDHLLIPSPYELLQTCSWTHLHKLYLCKVRCWTRLKIVKQNFWWPNFNKDLNWTFKLQIGGF